MTGRIRTLLLVGSVALGAGVVSSNSFAGVPGSEDDCTLGSCAPKLQWDCIHGEIHIPDKCDPQDPCCVICLVE